MKNSFTLLLLSVLSFGGFFFVPKQPASLGSPIEYTSQTLIDTFKEDNLQSKLDSIEKLKQKNINKYVKQIESSIKVIDDKQKELKKIDMHVDILLSQMDTVVVDSIILDTLKPVKKQSWIKKQINKLKNEKH